MAALASEFASRVTDIWCITTESRFADLRFADLINDEVAATNTLQRVCSLIHNNV